MAEKMIEIKNVSKWYGSVQVLRDWGEDERLRLAERTRERILARHTAAHRAEQLEDYVYPLLAAGGAGRSAAVREAAVESAS